MNDHPGPDVSPKVWTFPDYLGRTLTVSVSFNTSTRALSGGSAVRQAGCLYQTLLWGLGPDGTPDSSTHKIVVPVGTTTVSKANLSAIGLNTIDDVLALQFTVGF